MAKAGEPGTRDLIRTAAASLASLALIALPFGGLLKALALVPLVLVLPGYAISAAMFMPGSITRGERVAYTFSLSVGAAAIGGLAWQLLFGLDRLAWALLLTAIVLVATRIARNRRRARASVSPLRRRRLPRMSPATALALLAAVVLTVVATDTAIDGLHAQRAESHFSSLWIVPQGPREEAVEIGVLNHQGSVYAYKLSVDRSGIPVWLWKGRLGAHKRMQVSLGLDQIAGPGPIVVSLYQNGALYRQVALNPGSGS